MVGDVHHQAHVVLDQQDGDAAVADLEQELDQRLGLGGVQARPPARRAAAASGSETRARASSSSRCWP